MNTAKRSPSEATQFTVDHQPPITIRRKSPYWQALELQDLLMDDARKSDLKPVGRAIVARAWRELEQLKREIKMKPKPKAVDVSKPVPKRVQWREPVEVVSGPVPEPGEHRTG